MYMHSIFGKGIIISGFQVYHPLAWPWHDNNNKHSTQIETTAKELYLPTSMGRANCVHVHCTPIATCTCVDQVVLC